MTADRRRIVALGACAIVLIGAGVALAATGNDGSGRPRVIGSVVPGTTNESTSTSTTATTTSSLPLVFDASSAAPPSPREPINEPEAAGPTAPTEPAPLEPQVGSWSSTTSVDKAVVTVGDDFVVSVDLTNTGTQSQATSSYFSFGIACAAYPDTEIREGLPIGQFFTEAPVMQPGETHSFSITFHAEPEFVGSLRCGAAPASHGDANVAGPGANPVAVEIVPGPDGSTTTSTTDTVPTTDTTVL